MKGLIFIPDISGFTSFVKNIDIDLGVVITEGLLNAIIDINPLDVEVSEIEGDAILFYKTGNAISLNDLFKGIENMHDAFNTTFQHLKKLHHLKADLSLKFVVHYGDINVYNIKGFKKLYGETVIEAHTLLKNGYDASNYILITEDYFTALHQSSADVPLSKWKYATYCSKMYNGSKDLGFYFFTYQPNDSHTPPNTSKVKKHNSTA